MATVTWNTSTGLWFAGGNWDKQNDAPPPAILHVIPSAPDDAQIPDVTSSGNPFTVTYTGTSTIRSLNGSAVGTLDITGGRLNIATGGGFNAMAVNVRTGAILDIQGGTLVTTAGITSGTVTGNGTIVWVAGDYAVNAGAAFTIQNWVLGVSGNGTVSKTTLNTNLIYANTFTLADYSGNGARLNLNTHTLTLSGSSVIDGLINGAGTVRVTGDATLASGGNATGSVFGNAELVFASGSTGLQHQNVLLGDAATAGTLEIQAGATYTIDRSAQLGGNTGVNSFIENSGTLAVTGAGSIARLNGTLSNAGVLSAAAGSTMIVQGGTHAIGGSVTGAGAFVLGFAANTTLTTTNVTVASFALGGGNGGARLTLGTDLTYAGKFSFQGQFDTLDLNGRTLTLAGAGNSLIGNLIDGAGTLRVTGSATVGGSIGFGGPQAQGTALTFVNAGSVSQTGIVGLNGTIRNEAGRTWTVNAPSNIDDHGATFVNNGTLAIAAAGTTRFATDLQSTGSIAVANGANFIVASGTHTISGSVSGAGTFTAGFAAATTLNTSTITVANLALAGGNGGATLKLGANLAYAGAFSFQGQFDTLDLNGRTLTLSGLTNSLLGNTIKGGGTINVTGAATIGGSVGAGGAQSDPALLTLINNGTMTQNGYVYLRGTLTNAGGHAYNWTSAGAIVDYGGTVQNNGAFNLTAAGSSEINAKFVNTGALSIAASSILSIRGEATFGGTVGGAGALVMAGGALATIPSTNFTVASLALIGGTTTLTHAMTYAGAFSMAGFGTLNLAGHAFTATGATDIDGGILRGLNTAVDHFTVRGSAIDLSALGFTDWQPTDIVSLVGTSGNDGLKGSSQGDTIQGGVGFDTLVGLEGNDTLDGGANPSNQGDFLFGGAGNDTYRVDSALDFVDEGNFPAFVSFGFGGTDTIISTADFYWDLYSIGETIQVAQNVVDPGNDGVTIVAGVFNNTLIGHSGTDVMFGRGGSDVYRGGDGVDFMSLSTLGVTDVGAYVANGVNTVIVEQRTTGPNSYDIVFEFESGKDRLDVSDYGFASQAAAYATGVNDGAGNSYFVLGDGLDYLYMVGLTLSELSASDFIV